MSVSIKKKFIAKGPAPGSDPWCHDGFHIHVDRYVPAGLSADGRRSGCPDRYDPADRVGVSLRFGDRPDLLWPVDRPLTAAGYRCWSVRRSTSSRPLAVRLPIQAKRCSSGAWSWPLVAEQAWSFPGPSSAIFTPPRKRRGCFHC